MSDNAIFLIEGGPALELIQAHIAEKNELAAKIKELADEFGTTRVATNKIDGSLFGLHMDPSKPRHKDLTSPDANGISRPRKNTETAKRFKEIGGYTNPSSTIANGLGIPTQVARFKKGKYQGTQAIGNSVSPCGFMFITSGGPFAMWTPDVEAEIAAIEANEKGVVVNGTAKAFKMDIEGCRRLEHEEWQIIVLTHSLMRKQAAGQLISQRGNPQPDKS